ncbi:MAG: isopentenyl-diphosphate delta-isomerase [Bacteroidota bacterium]
MIVMNDKIDQTNGETLPTELDSVASSRKRDHIELAFNSQVASRQLDDRFYYEPLLSAHPNPKHWESFAFVRKAMRVPIWVSSMTGGTELAYTINHNLARACREFGMGMGLGSCRALLYSNERLADFDLRPTIGEDLPLYANLGVAQVEQLLERDELWRAQELVDKLRADGLIIHVNPFQEWLQPEGDHFNRPPIEIIRTFLAQSNIPVIVKEVGQGMGRESLRALLQLPLEAVDFAASGGTNFALLELLRSDPQHQHNYEKLAYIGHGNEDMVNLTNELLVELGEDRKCGQIIISGGVKDFLDGYYLMNRLNLSSVYGQASGFLKHARGDYADLRAYVAAQVKGLALAKAFLRIRK